MERQKPKNPFPPPLPLHPALAPQEPRGSSEVAFTSQGRPGKENAQEEEARGTKTPRGICGINPPPLPPVSLRH